MATNEDLVRLSHMLDAAQKAVAFTENRTRDDLDSDEMLTLAVVRLLEIVGEASKNISETLKTTYPEIPWQQIAGTRNRLITVTSTSIWISSGKSSPLISPPLVTGLSGIINEERS